MTDDLDAEAADARAENAFRTAFEQQAQVSPPGGFDGAAIRRKSRTRSTGLVAATAAAVLILCGGLVSAVQLTRDSAPSSTTAAEPYAGWRFEFYRDVRLQVPDSWGYADEPGSDWCAAVPGGMIPKQPYVARAEAYLFRLGIGCSEPGTPLYRRPPINTWVDHVTLQSGPGQAGVQRVGQFWVITKPVGHVVIKVVATDRGLANRILDSAETVDASDPSCDPRSDIQAPGFHQPSPAFDVTTLDDVDAILVCQYSLGDLGQPGLRAQYELSGSAADDELAALKSAPVGGGPDQPENCVRGEFGESAIVLHLAHGASSEEMYVYYASCRGNGFDDGTAIRTLTSSACQPLIKPPVKLFSGSAGSFRRCASE